MTPGGKLSGQPEGSAALTQSPGGYKGSLGRAQAQYSKELRHEQIGELAWNEENRLAAK